MSEKPKRNFWQIHLSTAIALTLTIAFLLHYQMEEWHEMFVYNSGEAHIDRPLYGWPMNAVVEYKYESGRIDFYYELKGITFDLLISLIILISVTFLLEWLIRRREARKP